MSNKLISCAALAIAVIACLVAYCAHIGQREALARMLKQHEAQVSQQYVELVRRMIEREFGNVPHLSRMMSMEESLEVLGAALRQERRLRIDELLRLQATLDTMIELGAPAGGLTSSCECCGESSPR